MKRFGFIALALFGAACGSNSTSSSGSVGGQSFSASDAIFTTVTSQNPSFSYTELLVVVTAFSNACNYATDANARDPNAPPPGAVLELGVLGDANGLVMGTTNITTATARALTAGDTSQQLALSTYIDKTGAASDATSGSITLNTLTTTGAEGTYDLKFADGSLSGSFKASHCDIPLSSNDG